MFVCYPLNFFLNLWIEAFWSENKILKLQYRQATGRMVILVNIYNILIQALDKSLANNRTCNNEQHLHKQCDFLHEYKHNIIIKTKQIKNHRKNGR